MDPYQKDDYYKSELREEIKRGKHKDYDKTYDHKEHLKYQFGVKMAKLYSVVKGNNIEEYKEIGQTLNGVFFPSQSIAEEIFPRRVVHERMHEYLKTQLSPKEYEVMIQGAQRIIEKYRKGFEAVDPKNPDATIVKRKVRNEMYK